MKKSNIHKVAAWTLLLAMICMLSSCVEWGRRPDQKESSRMSISKEPFGTMPDGQAVDMYTLTNSSGMTAKIITYGRNYANITRQRNDGYPAGP